MAEERDWTRTQAERCPDCGYDPEATPVTSVGDQLRAGAQDWNDLLVGTAVDTLRERPDADTWSPLEYACHVRDVLPVFFTRVVQSVNTDEPDFDWWDHEAAATDERYNEQDPHAVAADLVVNADQLAVALSGVPESAWSRVGTRRGVESFTVDGMARFTLHEMVHHFQDATASTG